MTPSARALRAERGRRADPAAARRTAARADRQRWRAATRSSSRRWLAMAGEAGDGEVVVPPTLQALLAARLDQLEPAERVVLERGAIEGEVFHRGAVQALSPERSAGHAALAALVRKELIRPDQAAARRRRRVPLPPPPDPRCRLRGAAEGGARRAARALCGLARATRRGARRARRDPGLPLRAGDRYRRSSVCPPTPR